MKQWASAGCASLLTAAMILQPLSVYGENGARGQAKPEVVKPELPKGNKVEPMQPVVELAPPSSAHVARYIPKSTMEPMLSNADKLALLQKKIKYVFVLFQENRSFDFYFGTYPGARGLYSQAAAQTPGLVQPIVNTDGTVSSISPFLMPLTTTDTTGKTVQLYPEDTDSVNHGHTAIDAKLDLDAKFVAQNDRYAFIEEGLKGTLSPDGMTYTGTAPTLAQKQKGELVLGHVDCTTAPFLWNYADRFTLFDRFFDTVIGPSTPNAIAMFAGQSGETMWAKYPELGANFTTSNNYVPVTGDPQPFWGSALDVFTPAGSKQPTEGGGAASTNPASNLTFASLGLSFMGNKVESITANDLDPAFDLADIQNDIAKLASSSIGTIPWAWYEQGYDLEPMDKNGTASHSTYIAHHDAPQYFGYEANNPAETAAHLKGLGDFFNDVTNKKLSPTGGVYYVRGGYGNNDGLTPRSPSPSVQANFMGNDDHPGYSDVQISEALLADEINAIANSPYWANSAIIITYDETDGLYDHAQPLIRSWDALGNALDQGPRIPAIVLSPYASVHTISHEASEHGSVIKFIDALFGLTPLAQLPDEAAARAKGYTEFGQRWLGPSDNPNLPIGSLFTGFDNGRLAGTVPPLPASYAVIPQSSVTSLPHFSNQGCRILQITPTDYVNGQLIDPAPADFNPRPGSNPGLPTTPGWPTN
ncbi:MAG: alkaline phosphatase family protein [Terracidiphilus sp.]